MPIESPTDPRPLRAMPARAWAARARALGTPRTMQIFLVVILLHILEHAAQAWQVFYLAWPRPEALGFLGLLLPLLVESEILHYAHAIVMLAGLMLFRHRFSGSARTAWDVALGLQVWHHLEHLLLLMQWAVGQPAFGAAQPTSILQLWVPRVELHLFYNIAVLVPMSVALMLQPDAWQRRARRSSRPNQTGASRSPTPPRQPDPLGDHRRPAADR